MTRLRTSSSLLADRLSSQEIDQRRREMRLPRLVVLEANCRLIAPGFWVGTTDTLAVSVWRTPAGWCVQAAGINSLSNVYGQATDVELVAAEAKCAWRVQSRRMRGAA